MSTEDRESQQLLNFHLFRILKKFRQLSSQKAFSLWQLNLCSLTCERISRFPPAQLSCADCDRRHGVNFPAPIPAHLLCQACSHISFIREASEPQKTVSDLTLTIKILKESQFIIALADRICISSIRLGQHWIDQKFPPRSKTLLKVVLRGLFSYLEVTVFRLVLLSALLNTFAYLSGFVFMLRRF